MENTKNDDGSLAFMNIPKQEDNKHFHCAKISQSDLVDKEFWILDYQDNIQTKFGENRYLVFIRFDLQDKETERKFFTGSTEVKYVLEKIKERNAFPRRVTLRHQRQSYWLE